MQELSLICVLNFKWTCVFCSVVLPLRTTLAPWVRANRPKHVVHPVGHCGCPSVPQIWLLPQTRVWARCACLLLQTRVSVPGATLHPMTPMSGASGFCWCSGGGSVHPCPHQHITDHFFFAVNWEGAGGVEGTLMAMLICISLELMSLHASSYVRGSLGFPPL